MNPSPVYIGVDVAKRSLAIHGPGLPSISANTPKALASLIKKLPKGAHLVMEATGGYERPLLDCLHANQIPCSVVNPRQVRDFAKGMGVLAKTDAIDAKIIGAFAACKTPEPTPAPSEAQRRLEALMTRRQQLLEVRLVQVNQIEHMELAQLKAQARTLLAFVERQIDKIDAMARELINNDELLSAKFVRLAQVKGVGFVTAASTLAFMPELGHIKRKAAAALLGVAPLACDSGQQRGKRRIWGGRANLRSVFYMAALTAAVRNPILRAFYRKLRAANKPAKVAIVAVMRKLIVLLNHILAKPHFCLAS